MILKNFCSPNLQGIPYFYRPLYHRMAIFKRAKRKDHATSTTFSSFDSFDMKKRKQISDKILPTNLNKRHSTSHQKKIEFKKVGATGITPFLLSACSYKQSFCFMFYTIGGFKKPQKTVIYQCRRCPNGHGMASIFSLFPSRRCVWVNELLK